MARNKICVICGKEITDDKAVPYKGRFAHELCFKRAMKLVKVDKDKQLETKTKEKKIKISKPKAELKDALSEEEYQDKQNFFAMLRELIKQDNLSAKIYKITEDYIKKYSFTYKGMTNTLAYYFQTLEKPVEGDCIGIIPYYYTEAQKICEHTELSRQINRELLDKDEIKYNVKIVHIIPKTIDDDLIDISKIGVKE